ncbi:hypothetical protein QJS10_CPB19g01276 [Acorus calamus]|uniref:Uncharacterized protein n=1 Tax=Acorus calamus TaxID=4465 RepID=A0AAV9CIG0_ACOCL|nr:hypothetical protein QJS10_CPB19g01276 [Acorus calamus]
MKFHLLKNYRISDANSLQTSPTRFNAAIYYHRHERWEIDDSTTTTDEGGSSSYHHQHEKQREMEDFEQLFWETCIVVFLVVPAPAPPVPNVDGASRGRSMEVLSVPWSEELALRSERFSRSVVLVWKGVNPADWLEVEKAIRRRWGGLPPFSCWSLGSWGALIRFPSISVRDVLLREGSLSLQSGVVGFEECSLATGAAGGLGEKVVLALLGIPLLWRTEEVIRRLVSPFGVLVGVEESMESTGVFPSIKVSLCLSPDQEIPEVINAQLSGWKVQIVVEILEGRAVRPPRSFAEAVLDGVVKEVGVELERSNDSLVSESKASKGAGCSTKVASAPIGEVSGPMAVLDGQRRTQSQTCQKKVAEAGAVGGVACKLGRSGSVPRTGNMSEHVPPIGSSPDLRYRLLEVPGTGRWAQGGNSIDWNGGQPLMGRFGEDGVDMEGTRRTGHVGASDCQMPVLSCPGVRGHSYLGLGFGCSPAHYPHLVESPILNPVDIWAPSVINGSPCGHSGCISQNRYEGPIFHGPPRSDGGSASSSGPDPGPSPSRRSGGLWSTYMDDQGRIGWRWDPYPCLVSSHPLSPSESVGRSSAISPILQGGSSTPEALACWSPDIRPRLKSVIVRSYGHASLGSLECDLGRMEEMEDRAVGRNDGGAVVPSSMAPSLIRGDEVVELIQPPRGIRSWSGGDP